MSDWLASHRQWVRERYSEGDVTAIELTDMYNKRFSMGRSVGSVTNQIRGIHPKKWTNEQIKWLKKNRGKSRSILFVEFNERFGTYRSYEAVKSKVSEITRDMIQKYGEEFERCTRDS